MSQQGTYRDRAVQQLLYDHSQGDEIRAMLEQSATNSRVNQQMAWWCVLCEQVCGSWAGNWRNLFGEMATSLQKHLLQLEGYARVQAIDMAMSRTTTEKQLLQQEKKGGLLGLLGQ